MAYFIYARKSEEDEGRQVQSIDDQLASATEIADSKSLNVINVFKESRSARRPGRPLFNEMVRRLEAGEADGIVCWHPDRLARNAVDAGIIIDLVDRGVLKELKFGSYTFENSPEGKWMLGIVLGQSKYFVDKLSKDVKRGIRGKLERGHYPHKAPIGYLNDRLARTVILDPDRSALIRRAFELVMSGSYGIDEVLRLLNDEWGFRSRRTALEGGLPLSRSGFYRLLGNPFYTGVMVHDGETFKGCHEPLLTHEEFRRIQNIVGRGPEAEGNHPSSSRRKEFDFTGLMACGRCGCQITASEKVKHYRRTERTRTYIYYHCTNAKRRCSRRGISQHDLEAQIAGLLSQITIPQEVIDWCLEPARRWHTNESGADHAVIESLRTALSQAERRKTNLIDARLNDPDLFTPEEFKSRKEELQAEIVRINAEIVASQERLATVQDAVENVLDFAVHAKIQFENGNSKMKREVARRLGIKYSFTLGKVEIEPHPLLTPIIKIGPGEIRSASEKSSASGEFSLRWCPIVDEIRTLAYEQALSFPRFTQVEA